MKIYQVTIKRGNEIQTTYCDYRPENGEIIKINGEKWTVVCWI